VALKDLKVRSPLYAPEPEDGYLVLSLGLQSAFVFREG
jgi:hypothetical protein